MYPFLKMRDSCIQATVRHEIKFYNGVFPEPIESYYKDSEMPEMYIAIGAFVVYAMDKRQRYDAVMKQRFGDRPTILMSRKFIVNRKSI